MFDSNKIIELEVEINGKTRVYRCFSSFGSPSVADEQFVIAENMRKFSRELTSDLMKEIRVKNMAG
jgi:hypothetical protein